MTRITPPILNETLNLLLIARETARANGSQEQVEKLTPVVNGIQELVVAQQGDKPAERLGEISRESNFRKLLEVAQEREAGNHSSPLEKAYIVKAMAEGGTPELDIARQLRISQEEVQLIISKQAGRIGKNDDD
jgi:hypothetical protein